jgi:hypothetical protein
MGVKLSDKVADWMDENKEPEDPEHVILNAIYAVEHGTQKYLQEAYDSLCELIRKKGYDVVNGKIVRSG